MKVTRENIKVLEDAQRELLNMTVQVTELEKDKNLDEMAQVIGSIAARSEDWIYENGYKQCQMCGKWNREVKTSDYWHDDGSHLEVCPECDVTEEVTNADD